LDGLLVGYPGITASVSTFLAVDAEIQASDNRRSSTLQCGPETDNARAGLDVTAERVTLLDSTLLGGDGYQTPMFHMQGCYQPASCDELSGGVGGAGCRSAGNVHVANVLSLGGKGTVAGYSPVNPPGFPCFLPDGEAYEVQATVTLGGGATLTGSGPAVENTGWSLHWFVEAPSILAIGPALLEPVQHSAGLLFMDPDKLILRPVTNIGPGSKTFVIGDLDEHLYGQVLGFQLYSPQQGLSRPVLAAVQPD